MEYKLAGTRQRICSKIKLPMEFRVSYADPSSNLYSKSDEFFQSFFLRAKGNVPLHNLQSNIVGNTPTCAGQLNRAGGGGTCRERNLGQVLPGKTSGSTSRGITSPVIYIRLLYILQLIFYRTCYISYIIFILYKCKLSNIFCTSRHNHVLNINCGALCYTFFYVCHQKLVHHAKFKLLY